MPPTIVLIRHAQALHNLHDPPLSDLGLEQCAALKEKLFSEYFNVDPQDVAIIASPMVRTLQTTLLGLGWLAEKGVKIEANADWQENSSKPCDTGSPIATVSPSFPQVDFTTVDPVFPDKTSPAGAPYACTRSAILARGKRCLETLHKRPEKLIFVVSHSGFLRLGVVGWWFFNSDYRVFDFEEGNEVRVQQRESTLEGGMGLSWAERVELGSKLPDEPEEDPAKEAH
ncbi:Fc.00g103010.m01.CDS01 [Cosmosporella sp. VM-42]